MSPATKLIVPSPFKVAKPPIESLTAVTINASLSKSISFAVRSAVSILNVSVRFISNAPSGTPKTGLFVNSATINAMSSAVVTPLSNTILSIPRPAK